MCTMVSSMLSVMQYKILDFDFLFTLTLLWWIEHVKQGFAVPLVCVLICPVKNNNVWFQHQEGCNNYELILLEGNGWGGKPKIFPRLWALFVVCTYCTIEIMGLKLIVNYHHIDDLFNIHIKDLKLSQCFRSCAEKSMCEMIKPCDTVQQYVLWLVKCVCSS